MPELSSTVATTLANYYEEIRAKVHEWTATVSTEQLWRKPYPYGNSIGHLLLHLTGNLNYYIGARIAGTGYVRDRDREFNDMVKKPKEQVIADFDRAVGMVVTTIRNQSPEDWLAPYSAEREPHSKDRFSAFFRCAAHAYHHVGQIIYLSKELAKPAS
ncbi:MAG: DinB family protein [Candidatus Acidiferrales bacterium]